MTMYIKAENGVVLAYPYSPQELKQDNPNVSFPKYLSEEVLNAHNVFSVHIKDQPETYDIKIHNIDFAKVPVYENGSWYVGWEVTSKTDEEIARYKGLVAAEVRVERDTRLAKLDWMAIRKIESGTEIPASVLAYRQALRDLPDQIGFPFTVEWPTLDNI